MGPKLADLLAAMTHRHSLEGLRAHQVCGIAERADLAGQVVQPQRPPAGRAGVRTGRGPSGQSANCLCSSGVKPEVTKSRTRPESSTVAINTVAGAGERAGAVDDLLQDGRHYRHLRPSAVRHTHDEAARARSWNRPLRGRFGQRQFATEADRQQPHPGGFGGDRR